MLENSIRLLWWFYDDYYDDCDDCDIMIVLQNKYADEDGSQTNCKVLSQSIKCEKKFW